MAAFIAEDGTGLPNSNSLCAVAVADDYHADRGAPAEWTASSTPQKQAALRTATEFVVLEMQNRWYGTRKLETQALPFPRIELVDRDGFAVADNIVPQGAQFCVAELALKVRQGANLLPDVVSATTIKATKIKLGPIEQSIEYGAGLSQPATTDYDKAMAFLAPFVSPPGELRRA